MEKEDIKYKLTNNLKYNEDLLRERAKLKERLIAAQVNEERTTVHDITTEKHKLESRINELEYDIGKYEMKIEKLNSQIKELKESHTAELINKEKRIQELKKEKQIIEDGRESFIQEINESYEGQLAELKIQLLSEVTENS